MARWRNWAGSVEARPRHLHAPRSIEELQGIVAGLRDGQRIRMAGSGHSFTPIVPSDDILLLPHDFGDDDSNDIGIDSARMVARIPAGMVLHEVNQRLAAAGFALANMGDITAQTMAGSISTSTHGTGLRFTGLAGQVAGFAIVAADGEVRECSESENVDIWRLGRVGLGALGVLTRVDMRIVPAFRLRAVEEPRRLDAVLDDFEAIVTSADHFEFFWVPHTRWALTKHNTRTDEPAQPRSAVAKWASKTLLENYAFGAVCALGRAVPALIPRLATALPSTGRSEFVEASHDVFATRRLVKFHEMEYSVPRRHLPHALRTIVEMVEREKLRLSFPVEVRVTAADDVALSTSYGRESAYIAVHMYKGMPYERYFRLVEEILAPLEGRPHWGKIHFLSAAELAPRYERFAAFLTLRERLDPRRRFTNRYVERMLGLDARGSDDGARSATAAHA
jgi:L-gulonolactone oxidase